MGVGLCFTNKECLSIMTMLAWLSLYTKNLLWIDTLLKTLERLSKCCYSNLSHWQWRSYKIIVDMNFLTYFCDTQLFFHKLYLAQLTWIIIWYINNFFENCKYILQTNLPTVYPFACIRMDILCKRSGTEVIMTPQRHCNIYVIGTAIRHNECLFKIMQPMDIMNYCDTVQLTLEMNGIS